jgi:hypothetical protein
MLRRARTQSADLHVALRSPQVFAGVVFADSKQHCYFVEREALNFFQEIHVSPSLGKQENPKQGQLERTSGIFAWYDRSIPG